MTLSKELVSRYQAEYERKYGQSITTKKAEQQLYNLSTLIRLIAEVRSKRNAK